ncbi:MAG: glycosyl hydrolase [Saprospiraceae bacterium]|nr:glycosyl hydrolase [Saprospiraceae bacterium]
MQIDNHILLEDLKQKLKNFWNLSGEKILMINQEFDPTQGAPVFTVAGKYSSRGWTEWTQGFQYGSAIIQFEVTRDEQFLRIGRDATLQKMAPHISHFGVHDHGFNNVSTYGNLHRLMDAGIIEENAWERSFYELALKITGAVQAKRWTSLPGGGYIYSFNGPHSLFVDTIRSLRALTVSHELGHDLKGENDRSISLLDRAIDHAIATATYGVFYGDGRDHYDVWGRTAHESIFNVNDGNFRCPNSQQGFSGFTTWTRGLAWAMLGYAEQLEYLACLPKNSFDHREGLDHIESIFLKAAKATCDFYIDNSASDGIPYWDTGAPGLSQMGDYLNSPADPFNEHEPVDSSAAAIGAQGLCRLGQHLNYREKGSGDRYWKAGLKVASRLMEDPYLSTKSNHQGITLHSIYHRPNGWDYTPSDGKIPLGESSMWGDYHMRELCLYLQYLLDQNGYYTYFNGVRKPN